MLSEIVYSVGDGFLYFKAQISAGFSAVAGELPRVNEARLHSAIASYWNQFITSLFKKIIGIKMSNWKLAILVHRVLSLHLTDECSGSHREFCACRDSNVSPLFTRNELSVTAQILFDETLSQCRRLKCMQNLIRWSQPADTHFHTAWSRWWGTITNIFRI